MQLGPLATDADDDPGVQLFVDRACHARPDFRLTDANRDDVRAVCSAVDGISLGIELAAARVRALSPSELAARLVDRFRLVGNLVTSDARHRTRAPAYITSRQKVAYESALSTASLTVRRA